MFQRVPQIETTTPYRTVKMDLKKITAFVMLVLMVIPSLGMAMGFAVLTVETDSLIYEPGEDVEISGMADPNENISLIVIFNATQDTVFNETILAEEDGNYSVTYKLPVDALEGIYNVTAYNETEAETFFEVVQPEPPEEEAAVGLVCAIDRALLYIEKVNSTAVNFNETGYNVAHFWDTLDELNRTLTELRYNITEEDMPLEEAAKIFSELRGDIGRLNGLLSSCAKKVKMEKAERYMEHMERLINSTIERIERLNETDKGGKLRAALEAQSRKLWRLRLQLNVTNLEDTIGACQGTSNDIDASLTEFDSEGFSLKAMFKVQAKIQVFNATVERMKNKGKGMNNLEHKLGNANQLMEQMMEHLTDQDNLDELIEEAEEDLKGVGKTIRQLNKPGTHGKSKP